MALSLSRDADAYPKAELMAAVAFGHTPAVRIREESAGASPAGAAVVDRSAAFAATGYGLHEGRHGSSAEVVRAAR